MSELYIQKGLSANEEMFLPPYDLNSSVDRVWGEILAFNKFPFIVGKGMLEQFIRGLAKIGAHIGISSIKLVGKDAFLITKYADYKWEPIESAVSSTLQLVKPEIGDLTIVRDKGLKKEVAYKIIDFDIKQFALRMIWIALVSAAATILNQVVSTANPSWLKAGENGMLFLVHALLIGLFFALLISVSITGSDAWNKLVTLITDPSDLPQEKHEKLVNDALKKRPDSFLAISLLATWVLILVMGIFIYFPIELCWAFGLLATLSGMFVVFAFDYWGFTSGIKRIEITH